MRIIIVTHNVIKGDGQGRANYEIARYVRSQGQDVHLVADAVSPDLLEQGISLTKVPLHPKLRRVNLFKVFEFAQRANRIVSTLAQPGDVVHNYGYCASIPHQVNTSQFVHSAWIKSKYHPSRQLKGAHAAYQWCYSFLNALWEKKAYHAAKSVVAASSTVREELKGIGIPDTRLRVILNGADPTEFFPGTVEREPLGLPVSVPLGLFAGDIRSNRKNLDSVLMALAQVPEAHLAVVGRVDGSPFPALAEQLKITDRVHFLDFRRDIAQIMRAVDYFVFPSRYEACALVLAEAIASGLPVITARTTGGSELVRDGAGVLLDDANDVPALAAAIRRVSTDPDARAAMAEAARKLAPGCSWDSIVQSYYAHYQELGS